MSTLSFTTFTEERTVTKVTWQVSATDIKKLRELRAECKNDSVNDLNFQFKIVSFEDHEKNLSLMKLYFRCRNEVHINSIKCIAHGHAKECKVYVNRVMQPYEWLYISNLEIYDDLNIKLEIETILNKKIDPSFIFEPRLFSDFKNLLHNGSFSDAIMKSADGEEYKVHKAFLTSRSPVLKAHFEHNTKESVTNILESPLESEVLNEVISFIYTDRAPNVAKMPEKLLAAANFYQLDRLKGLSEEALNKNLTADNALYTLELAELYSCENLKKLTLQFIKDEAQLVTKTEAWAKLNSLELIKNLFEFVTKKE